MKLFGQGIVFGCLLGLASAAGIAFGQEVESGLDTLTKSLQKDLDQFVADHDFPGSTLAVVLPDGHVISLASGVEDRDQEGALKPAARMFAGSTGKVIVSAVALSLVDEGKLDLDARVRSCLPESDYEWFDQLPNAEDLTIRSLMNHTSGLPRYIFQEKFLTELRENPYRDWTPRDCLSIATNLDPVHAVGEGWAYSDTNYMLLGVVMEAVSGKEFYSLSDAMFIKPLELKDTFPCTQAELEGLTQGHIGPQNFLGLPSKTVSEGKYAVNPEFEWCGGGFVTSSVDLAKIVKAIHSSDMISPETYKQFVQAVHFRTGKKTKFGYGLGTFVWNSPSGLFYGHAGFMPGHLTQVEFSKDMGFSIAIQTNTDATQGARHHAAVQSVARKVEGYLKKD